MSKDQENSRFDEELSDAIGQRNEAWHAERLGRFTSSRFGDLMSTGTAGTTARRKRIDKQLKEKEITKKAYDEELKDIENIEYNARFGEGCRTYVFEKMAELMTNSVHMTGGSAATEWGTDQEEYAISEYENRYGKTVKPCGFVKYGELAGGSPDGKIVGEKAIIEVKCPYNPANHIRTVITNEIHKAYFWQVHGNILATDAEYCDFISYDPRMIDPSLRMHVIRVKRNIETLDILRSRIQEVADFMKIMMENADLYD